MDFGHVLTRSWEIIWKNKVLWIFGILASCSGQSRGSSFNYGFDSSNTSTGQLPPGIEQWFNQLEARFNSVPEEQLIAIIIGLVVLAILLGLVFFVIGLFGKVGLIKGAQQAEAGMALSFRQLARDAYAVLWRAAGLNLLLFIIPFIIVLALVLAGSLLVVGTMGIGLICLIPLACLILLVFIAYGIYVEFANLALVSEDLGVMDAVSRGWEVVRNNVGNVLVMALVLMIGGGIITILIGLPIVAIAFPAVIGGVSGTQDAFTTGLTISAICLVLALPVLILLGGILQSYIQSAWTLTYLQLTGAAPAKK
jgi:hypothetical protein